jgi:hypothetical protein
VQVPHLLHRGLTFSSEVEKWPVSIATDPIAGIGPRSRIWSTPSALWLLRNLSRITLRLMKMTDVLDPERAVYCVDCECPSLDDGIEHPPFDVCQMQWCSCHAAYWMTVPEWQKREMAGDR